MNPRSRIAVLTFATALSGCGMLRSEFVRVCETALKGRLPFPSTYVLKSVEEDRRALGLDEFHTVYQTFYGRPYHLSKGRMKANGDRPTLRTATIEYVAAGRTRRRRFGTANCVHLSPRPDGKDLRPNTVLVDGETNTQHYVRTKPRD